MPVNTNPMTDVYALFPRSEAELKTIFDGRWDLPPYPVRCAVPAYFAQPLAYRRQAQSGVMAVGMADPKECYAICIPVNDPPDDPNPTKGYQGIYFYFFGRNLRQGEPPPLISAGSSGRTCRSGKFWPVGNHSRRRNSDKGKMATTQIPLGSPLGGLHPSAFPLPPCNNIHNYRQPKS